MASRQGRRVLVRVADLLREPGSQRPVERDIDLRGLSTTAAAADDDPAHLDAVVTAMAGGVEVIGDLSFGYTGECRRCLQPVTGTIDVEVREIAQRDPVDEEIFPIDGDVLDLEPIVRELALAHLPLAPLCGDDCDGPAPDRFPTTTEDEADAEAAAAEPVIDPRWAVLSELDLGP